MPGVATKPFEVAFHAAPLPPPLDAFIEVVWAVKGMTFYQKETVLPNGGIELMINFGSLQRVLAFGSQASPADHPRYWVAGLQSQPLTIESTGDSDLLSIRFRPGGAHAVFGLPIDELNDQVIDLDLLPGIPIERLRSRLAAAVSFLEKLSLVQEWLLSNLHTQEYEHGLVAGAVAAIQQAPGGQRIGDLCEQIGLSHKHTIDIFRRVVGVPPKTLARILRFNKLIQHVSTDTEPDWAGLAAQFNYYDQSHLIREFQRLAGVTPTQYLARRTPEGTSLLVD